MKKLMMMGRIACGKTTLCQYLMGEALTYRKTQTVQLMGDAIDMWHILTPLGNMWRTAP